MMWTPRDLAEYLQVAEAALADWRYWHRGPAFVKVGRLVRDRESEVERWLDGSPHSDEIMWGELHSVMRSQREDAGSSDG